MALGGVASERRFLGRVGLTMRPLGGIRVGVETDMSMHSGMAIGRREEHAALASPETSGPGGFASAGRGRFRKASTRAHSGNYLLSYRQ